jgi:phosphoribosyl-ATP pyrophosphohydrolase
MRDTAYLQKLPGVLRQRLAYAPAGSYTAQLDSQGKRKVAHKLGEVGLELALADAAQDRARVTG